MPRYLSDEWFDAAAAAFARRGELPGIAADVRFVVAHVVAGGPDGDVTFHLRVDQGAVQLRRGAADDATVVFTEPYETAAAIARGEQSPQGAFITGDIRVHGDVGALIDHGAVFAGIDDVLAPLRANTTY